MITVNEDIGIEIEAEVNAEAEMNAFVFVGEGGTPDGLDGGHADTSYPSPTEDPWLAQIQIRRDTLADWISENPTLRFGEFGFISDQKFLVMGDGVSDFNTLVADSENIYETKKYIDDLISNVYASYDGVIAILIQNIFDLSDQLAIVQSSLPKFNQRVHAVGLSVTDFTTDFNFVNGTLMVFRGGEKGRVLIDVSETGPNSFTLVDDLDPSESLICQYIEQP